MVSPSHPENSPSICDSTTSADGAVGLAWLRGGAVRAFPTRAILSDFPFSTNFPLDGQIITFGKYS